MWKCRFRANEGRDLVRERIRSDVMEPVALPTTVTGMRYDGHHESEDVSLHSNDYRPISNAVASRYPLRNPATGGTCATAPTAMGTIVCPRSAYARSVMSTSEYARSARCSVYDDVDLEDDSIAQKLKEMRLRKVYTTESDDEVDVDDNQDKDDAARCCRIGLRLDALLRTNQGLLAVSDLASPCSRSVQRINVFSSLWSDVIWDNAPARARQIACRDVAMASRASPSN
ncbi:hypothetical protein BIW11_04274 [Tropilaelaps mercedesae]|uniref:Uncharacterized protein n=1 Tax=Tropilaelaps mercedesae TaxID=418985 RepID=A0A1V9X8L5_9ACAR|nr:hypothetical protein BIW11_04274 [Tropilaelaps mercedesae]